MPFSWHGSSYQKAILWHEVELLDQDESRRDPQDAEADATLQWFDPRLAFERFTEQGARLGDWDYSAAIGLLGATV